MNQPPETPLPGTQDVSSHRRNPDINAERNLRRGRPQGNSDAREALLNTARDLFSSRPYRTVTLREVARYAGVDAALVRYYFGSKAGLFEAMMRDTLAPVLDALHQAGVRGTNHDQPPAAQQQTEHLMQTYYRIMGRHPQLPRLVFRILNEGDDLETFAILSRVFGDVVQASDIWLKNGLLLPGELAQNVNPEFARLSFLSLMIFPLVAPPVILRRIGISINPDTLTALAGHNSRLFSQGVFTPPESAVSQNTDRETLT